MYEEFFPMRLTQLRINKGISAREMSLSLGQNAGYINNIETGKALPSMANFFYICEYLEISPMDFFDIGTKEPDDIERISIYLKQIDPELVCDISRIVKALAENSPAKPKKASYK